MAICGWRWPPSRSSQAPWSSIQTPKGRMTDDCASDTCTPFVVPRSAGLTTELWDTIPRRPCVARPMSSLPEPVQPWIPLSLEPSVPSVPASPSHPERPKDGRRTFTVSRLCITLIVGVAFLECSPGSLSLLKSREEGATGVHHRSDDHLHETCHRCDIHPIA